MLCSKQSTLGSIAQRHWPERCPPASLVGRELPVRGRPAFLLHAAAERSDPERLGDIERRCAPLRLLVQLDVVGRLIRREVGWRLGRVDLPGGGTTVEGHRQPDTATHLPPDVMPARHRHVSSAPRDWGWERSSSRSHKDPAGHRRCASGLRHTCCSRPHHAPHTRRRASAAPPA
jgi:hypothetical protein